MPFRRGHSIREFMGRNRELYLISKQRYYQKYKEKHLHDGWVRRIRREFGLSEAQYNEMLDAQDGLCAICQQPESKTRAGRPQHLCVDHCHKTGKIRGLLCFSCNLSLGHFGDNPDVIIRAAAYVEERS